MVHRFQQRRSTDGVPQRFCFRYSIVASLCSTVSSAGTEFRRSALNSKAFFAFRAVIPISYTPGRRSGPHESEPRGNACSTRRWHFYGLSTHPMSAFRARACCAAGVGAGPGARQSRVYRGRFISVSTFWQPVIGRMPLFKFPRPPLFGLTIDVAPKRCLRNRPHPTSPSSKCQGQRRLRSENNPGDFILVEQLKRHVA